MNVLGLRVIISCQAFLVLLAVVFPGDLYTVLFSERNSAYLNLELIFVVSVNLAAFAMAWKFLLKLPRIKSRFSFKSSISLSSSLYFSAPLILFGLLVIFFIVIFVKQNADIMHLMFVNATLYKERYVGNFFYFSIYMLYGAIFWAMIKMKSINISSCLLSSVVFAGIILVFISSFLIFARYIIIPFIIGLFVAFSWGRKVSIKNLVKVLSVGVIVFMAMSLLRLDSDNAMFLEVPKQFFGYTIVSYNRFSEIINGDLSFSYSDTGFYLFPFLSRIPLLHNFIPSAYGVSDIEVTLAEFSDVASSGLNSRYIWATVYGYIFDTLGYFSIVYFAFLGALGAFLYRKFKEAGLVGVVFYPWFFSSMLLLFSFNILFMPQVVGFVYVFLFLGVWESIFRVKSPPFVNG